MVGRIYLGGGGNGQDEAWLWDQMLQGCRRLLYWPFALGPGLVAGADAWLGEQLKERAAQPQVVTWTSLQGRDPAELDGFDLLFVGGGNTFALLDQVRKCGFVERVRRHVATGGDYYGGSAGAILACDSIAIAETADPNEVGLCDLSGLGLLPGVSLLPHYSPEQENAAREWSRRHQVPVIGVPERAGVVVDGGIVSAVGPELVWIIEDGRDAIAYPNAQRLFWHEA